MLKKKLKKLYLSRSVSPCQMAELGISGDSNNLAINAGKLLSPVTECNQFGWADKGTGRCQYKYKLMQDIFIVNIIQYIIIID